MQNGKIRVMVFPAEGNNAAEIHAALATCVNIEVFGVSSTERHGKFVFENYYSEMPSISDNDFLHKLNEYIDENNIDLIFPTHDTVVKHLTGMARNIHCRLTVPDIYTAEITRSKIKTWELFADKDFVPKRYHGNESPFFPLFAKPDEGQGAKGAQTITDIKQLELIDAQDFLITEYLPGREFTVDCFTDKDGKLRFVSARTRERLRAGVTDRGSVIGSNPIIDSIAEEINSRLKFTGLWYFQLKEDKNNNLKLMEISARCAGTMCLSRAQGVNLPLLTVYAALGYETEILPNPYNVTLDRGLINCYQVNYKYDKVYLDFDDTVTLRGKINLSVMRYIYQCANQSKKVFLLTKHADNILQTLDKLHISQGLFSEILHISPTDSKAKVIKQKGPADSIFIDNMFKERQEVAKECHIPVFDVDQIEVLQDYRF